VRPRCTGRLAFTICIEPARGVDMQTVEINESLIITNVASSRTRFLEVLEQYDGPLKFDLENVNDCDTSGVQLLLSVCKFAVEENKKISFCNFSESIHRAFANTGIENLNDFITPEQ
jgi:anti-anti-sigma regulatory factor